MWYLFGNTVFLQATLLKPESSCPCRYVSTSQFGFCPFLYPALLTAKAKVIFGICTPYSELRSRNSPRGVGGYIHSPCRREERNGGRGASLQAACRQKGKGLKWGCPPGLWRTQGPSERKVVKTHTEKVSGMWWLGQEKRVARKLRVHWFF